MNIEPVRQYAILKKWNAYLGTLPYVVSWFVEGSLVKDTGLPPCPSSDIDMRVVIADDCPDNFYWTTILKGIEPYRRSVFASGTRNDKDYLFIRVITDDGVVIDLDIYRESDAESMKSVIKPPAETWPTTRTITPDTIRQQTTDFAVVMAAIPSSFYSGEVHSTRFQLELYRIDLVRLMYDCVGVDYARRYKHFSELFPDEYLSDLWSTYGDLSFKGMALSMIVLWRMVGKYLQILSDRVDGGFDTRWYWNIWNIVEEQLAEFE